MDFDDKISKENTNKSDTTVPAIPECVVCATTSPEKGFIYTTQTKLGISLHVFVQKIKKTGPLDNTKCITICQSCYDSINALEEAQKKVEIYGDDSSDSDSDKPPKIKIPKMVTCNSLISKFKPYFTLDQNEDDDNNEVEGKDVKAEDKFVSPTTETNQEIIERNTTHKCSICNYNFYRFSYGRDFSKENATDKPLNCLICERLFTPRRNNKRKKPLTDQKPFGCYICKSRFSHEEGLRPHLKYHTSQTPYQCHACGLKFIKRPKLLNHLKNCNPCACEVMCYQVCWGY